MRMGKQQYFNKKKKRQQYFNKKHLRNTVVPLQPICVVSLSRPSDWNAEAVTLLFPIISL